ncbi:uncharacterized protein LOC128279151 [Anopheles cruzii]|uniref:uncharacterized protein LOC128279151 n=1 Tax=Anopheles cruzii TaxID=68878 RepID=UPI0022EC894C|nr:uncharacterized protein LOC128279151 [Anopheles cruzii]
MNPRTVANAFCFVAIVQVSAIVDFNIDGDPKSDSQVCCKLEYGFPQDPFHECVQQGNLDPGRTNVTYEELMCLHKCYYESIGMFSGSKMIVAKYRQYAESLDQEQRVAFNRCLAVCVAFTANTMQNSKLLKQMACSPVPYLFNRCLAEVGIAVCPTARWINASFCDELAQRIKRKYGMKP